jgi:hypothetical protein
VSPAESVEALAPVVDDLGAEQPLVAFFRSFKPPPGVSVQEGDVFLNDHDAARFLRVSARTLQATGTMALGLTS